MKLRTKRTRDRILIGVGALVIGGVAAFASALGDNERIADTQIHVVVDRSGSGRVSEVIDYDFGTASDRHGIFRDVPGLTSDSNVEVSSDAPDQFVLIGDRIKIGDPNQTIGGRHRYAIGYTLRDVAPGGQLGFNGVGAGWDVPITEATIVVTGPFDWSGLRCDRGSAGQVGGCTARQVEPGRIDVHVSDLDSHEGVSIYADEAQPIAAAPALPAFHRPPADDSPALLVPFLVALAAALAAGAVVSFLIRRAGAEWVTAGGAADAAFPGSLGGPGAALPPPPGHGGRAPVDGAGGSARRVDQGELATMATTEFAPPAGLDAPYGGIVLREGVRPEHKVAWLIEQVAYGSVALDNTTGTSTLIRTDSPERPLHPLLHEGFGGRPTITLGSYDARFASAWSRLGGSLEDWRRSSGLWDRTGDRNRTRALVGGILLGVVGMIAVVGGAVAGLLPIVAIGAVLAGGGLAAALRSWELLIRTPVGSALWLRVESFRRFLSESETQHVDWAVEHGLLREYTAWAVAVGEIDRWERAVAGSTTARTADPSGAQMVYLAPLLMTSTASTATAPSSSGSGGFGGGGGVGGGAGGGGGGSW